MYSDRYNSSLIRSNQYDTIEQIQGWLDQNYDSSVDLGCGTCRKTIRLSSYVSKIFAIDRNQSMLQASKKILDAKGISNIRLIEADNFATPLPSRSFDVVTSFLSRYSSSEVHRLLKRDGKFIIEAVGGNDKRQLKKAFGTDDIGPRGMLLNQTPEERLSYLKYELSSLFEIEKLINVEFNTHLNRAGLIELLTQTPTIRGFSLSKDIDTINALCSNEIVTFNEHRIIILARSV